MFRFIVVMILSVTAVCVSAKPSEVINAKAEAEKTVEAYRELRKHCAASVDEARADCFNQLHKQNDKYQSAKEYLARAKPADINNLHIVSEAY